MIDPENITIEPADLHDPEQGRAIVELLDLYAQELEAGSPLTEEVRANLIAGLQQQTSARVLLAIADRPVGVAVCFLGFSTFHAKPLVNIHDLAVHPDFRGRGIGGKLLAAVEQLARDAGCCRITLEVNAGNPARHLYDRHGYGAQKGPEQYFLMKTL